jgi:hypothetical protein
MVYLSANTNPLAKFVVVVTRHMSHYQLACFQAQGVQKF